MSAQARSRLPASVERVAPGVTRLRTLLANVFFLSADRGVEAPWFLIDAGLRGYADSIRRTAAELFGERPPAAVLLTHGHFDHVGSLGALLRDWVVPVYAHPLEFPYLTGQSAYPAPDPSVGGGLMARLSFLYPRGPIDVGPRLLALPPDGMVPGLDGWVWVHTPGHSPGHVSFFRTFDRVLIAGDAIVTTRQESALWVLLQREQLRPPPAYYTIDWPTAGDSVRRLARLDPRVLASGHGHTIGGARLARELTALVSRFEEMIPRRGRYVERPLHPSVVPASATYALPPMGRARRAAVPIATAAAMLAAGLYWSGHHRRGEIAIER